MSQQTQDIDPRTDDLPYDLTIGMSFEHKLGSVRTIIYMDEDIVILRSNKTYQRGEYDEGNHRICTENRDYFREKCKFGEYKPVDDGGVGGPLVRMRNEMERFEESDGRTAMHKAEALRDLFGTMENTDVPADHSEPVDFESISGIGSKAAQSLRSNGFRTKGDVREAERESIVELPYMGEKNTDALQERVA